MRTATGDLRLHAVHGEVDGQVGEASADLSGQPPGNDAPAGVGDLRRHSDAGGSLVVEAGHDELSFLGFDHKSGQDREARATGQAPRNPGHGLGQHIAFDADLHRRGPLAGRGSVMVSDMSPGCGFE
jgi:hypothetical protein